MERLAITASYVEFGSRNACIQGATRFPDTRTNHLKVNSNRHAEIYCVAFSRKRRGRQTVTSHCGHNCMESGQQLYRWAELADSNDCEPPEHLPGRQCSRPPQYVRPLSRIELGNHHPVKRSDTLEASTAQPSDKSNSQVTRSSNNFVTLTLAAGIRLVRANQSESGGSLARDKSGTG